tara:strand:- start:1019 stop:1288 length:270 start_codon:yes stop_codon:yes gene_type:complete
MAGDGPAISRRLRELIHALHLELERLEWVDRDAEIRGPDELDHSFDIDTWAEVGMMPAAIDDDFPDETDEGPIGPLCVECGNFGRSCVC